MQRKLNTRFLVVLTVLVSGTIIVAVVGGRYLFRGTAEKHVEMAKLYKDQGRLADAAEEYKLAIGLDRRNPEVYVNLGDVMHDLTASDPTAIDKDKQYWNMALEADPSYLPAMQKLLGAYLDDAQLFRRAGMYAQVRDTCERILAVDPTDGRARANKHIALIESWLSGVATPADQITESIKELAALQAKD